MPQAEALLQGLHFTPFERNRHPVPVRFNLHVSLLPPVAEPLKKVAFPQVKDWKSVKITLRRTMCFGSCPAYSVEVDGDGSVLYQGQAYVAFTGTHRALVPQESVGELVKMFELADYYSLRDEYSLGATDLPTYTTSIEIDGRRKQVTDYAGEAAGMPSTVSQLEAAIDRVSGAQRWIRGDSGTLVALEAEHWDFKSKQAAETLVRVAESGDAAAVRDLLSAGVPLLSDPNPGSAVASTARSALVMAAKRGEPAMLEALLAAGASTEALSMDRAVVAAAGSGNVKALQILLQNGGHITSRDANGRTPLMAAAASGRPAMVKELLKNPIDVNALSAPLQTRPCHGENCEQEQDENRRAHSLDGSSLSDRP
jgi:hypothetical protein